MERQILHVEIGAFAVEVERVVDPRLAGRPVLLVPAGTAGARVLAASAEARAAGVRSGMALPRALRLARDASVLSPNEPLYRRAASALTDLLGDFSPLIEPTGYGRAFVDLTGTRRLFGSAQDLAARIERDVRQRLRLRTTVGLASNKLVSRVASRLLPPASLCDVFSGSERTFLAPLAIRWLPDLEPATCRTLAELNLRSIGELGALSLPQLALACGPVAARLYRQARGVDESPVRPPERLPAVAVDETLAEDSNDEAAAAAALTALAERVGRLLRGRARAAATLRLRLRYADGVEAVRALRPRAPVHDDFSIREEGLRLLEQVRQRRLRLRYLELRAENLVPASPARDLFGPRREQARRADLCAALDHLRRRHGEGIVRSGARWARRPMQGAGSRRGCHATSLGRHPGPHRVPARELAQRACDGDLRDVPAGLREAAGAPRHPAHDINSLAQRLPERGAPQ